MMKRVVAACITVLLVAASAWAHKPLVSVDDNGDGTIYIEVGFSDGSSGAGHTVILKDKATGASLGQKQVPSESSLELPMPDKPYIVVFNAGEGHAVEQEGPFTVRTEVTPEAPAAAPAATAATVATQPVAMGAAAAPVYSAPPAPLVAAQPVGGTPGMEMAFKMMVISVIVSTVLLVLLFGGMLFAFGYVLGRKRRECR